jgi:hypothetical protein
VLNNLSGKSDQVQLAVSHLVGATQRIVFKKYGFSTVPVLNGLIGSAGCLTSSDPWIRALWWVPFLVDWGCAPWLIEEVIGRLFGRTTPNDPRSAARAEGDDEGDEKK